MTLRCRFARLFRERFHSTVERLVASCGPTTEILKSELIIIISTNKCHVLPRPPLITLPDLFRRWGNPSCVTVTAFLTCCVNLSALSALADAAHRCGSASWRSQRITVPCKIFILSVLSRVGQEINESHDDDDRDADTATRGGHSPG